VEVAECAGEAQRECTRLPLPGIEIIHRAAHVIHALDAVRGAGLLLKPRVLVALQRPQPGQHAAVHLNLRVQFAARIDGLVGQRNSGVQ